MRSSSGSMGNNGISRRRVMSRDEAVALGKRLLDLGSKYNFRVSIEHTATAITRVARGSILNTDDGEEMRVSFLSACGSGIPIRVSTNHVNDDLLIPLIERVKSLVPPPEPPIADRTEEQLLHTAEMFREREFEKVSLWHDSSANAMESARAQAVPALIDQLQASQLRSAATVGVVARSTLHYYRYGLCAFSEETDCEVTVTARTRDGTGSGWGGVANRDWARCAPSVAATHAIDIAKRSENPVALEPGRRTVILGPAAVAQLMYQMAELFDGKASNWPGIADLRFGTPFTYRKGDGSGRGTYMGLRVMDDRLMMISDPADPDGGFPPFFNGGGGVGTEVGFPTPAITWIDRGILKNLSWGMEAINRRVLPGDWPYSMRLCSAPGVKTATIEEMIAACQEGIYVNRFSNVTLLEEGRGAALMTGATRDGCFLIKNGKIERPVKNFQFVESFSAALNRVEMIGTAERVPFGINAPVSSWQQYFFSAGLQQSRWPRPPMIVPPLKIRDFNFTALSDAI